MLLDWSIYIIWRSARCRVAWDAEIWDDESEQEAKIADLTLYIFKNRGEI